MSLRIRLIFFIIISVGQSLLCLEKRYVKNFRPILNSLNVSAPLIFYSDNTLIWHLKQIHTLGLFSFQLPGQLKLLPTMSTLYIVKFIIHCLLKLLPAKLNKSA